MNEYYDDIKAAVDVLRRGGLILYPTDTIWGIGCDATNPEAVKRVYALKHRADSKALITLVGDIDALYRTVDNVPEVAVQLIEVSVDPVTIVYDHGSGVAANLLASDGSLAVRVTHEAFSRQLCKFFGKPLVSTSANISTEPAPKVYGDIKQAIIDGVDYVCTSRRYEARASHRPSMVMKIKDNGEFRVLRK